MTTPNDAGSALAAAIEEHLELRRRRAGLTPPVPDGRPPGFLFSEVVRVAGESGDCVVMGAVPASDGQGWVMHLRGELGTVRELVEDVLSPTGWLEVVDDAGAVERVPLDRTRHRGWRDDVMVELELPSPEAAESVEAAVRALVGAGSVAVDASGGPQALTVWLFPDGDALDAFEQLIASVDAGWEHDEDESLFLTSRWKQQAAADVFLAPGVIAAEVTYRRWMSPERRGRRFW